MRAGSGKVDELCNAEFSVTSSSDDGSRSELPDVLEELNGMDGFGN